RQRPFHQPLLFRGAFARAYTRASFTLIGRRVLTSGHGPPHLPPSLPEAVGWGCRRGPADPDPVGWSGDAPHIAGPHHPTSDDRQGSPEGKRFGRQLLRPDLRFRRALDPANRTGRAELGSVSVRVLLRPVHGRP